MQHSNVCTVPPLSVDEIFIYSAWPVDKHSQLNHVNSQQQQFTSLSVKLIRQNVLKIASFNADSTLSFIFPQPSLTLIFG